MAGWRTAARGRCGPERSAAAAWQAGASQAAQRGDVPLLNFMVAALESLCTRVSAGAAGPRCWPAIVSCTPTIDMHTLKADRTVELHAHKQRRTTLQSDTTETYTEGVYAAGSHYNAPAAWSVQRSTDVGLQSSSCSVNLAIRFSISTASGFDDTFRVSLHLRLVCVCLRLLVLFPCCFLLTCM